MHDIKDHIGRPCPDCLADGLRWTGYDKHVIHCDHCDCEWTIEDLLDELSLLEQAIAQALN